MERFVFLGIRRLAKIARPLAKRLVGIFFAHGSNLLPVKRAGESSMAIAFWHPRPSYRIHILLAPKRAVADLAELSYQECCTMLDDIFELSGKLVSELGMDVCGYRLILNGGGFQEIPQLHFHLIAE